MREVVAYPVTRTSIHPRRTWYPPTATLTRLGTSFYHRSAHHTGCGTIPAARIGANHRRRANHHSPPDPSSAATTSHLRRPQHCLVAPARGGTWLLSASLHWGRETREVSSLTIWCFCFLGYMAIGTSDPITRDQLAYARLIVSEVLRHGGVGWLDYNRTFHQQPATDPSLRWNTLLPCLQASTILGRGSDQGAIFCTLCREVDHTRSQCALQCLIPTAAARSPITAPSPGGPRTVCLPRRLHILTRVYDVSEDAQRTKLPSDPRELYVQTTTSAAATTPGHTSRTWRPPMTTPLLSPYGKAYTGHLICYP